MWRRMRDWWSPAVAVDLGTAWTRLASATTRVRIEAPSRAEGRVPLRAGVVVDPDAAVALLTPLLARMRRFAGRRPRILVGLPSDADADERAAAVSALRASGAAAVALVPEPLAAAVGAGLDAGAVYATLVVDVGEGVTDAALVAEGRVLASAAVRIGCTDLRAARGYGLIATSDAPRTERPMAILDAALEAACALVRDLPARRACEVIESGITMTGGGATVPGLAARLAERTGIVVRVAPAPSACVVDGITAMLPAADELGLWD